MKVTVFQRVMHTHEGKAFNTYCARLKRKDGTEQYVNVKFKQNLTVPTDFPAILTIEKTDANLSRKEYTDKDSGDVGYRYTLWVSNYTATGEKFVDHSLDDFE